MIFRKKAEEGDNFMKRGETIMISTHSLGLVKSMLRGLVIDKGKIVFDGDSSDLPHIT